MAFSDLGSFDLAIRLYGVCTVHTDLEPEMRECSQTKMVYPYPVPLFCSMKPGFVQSGKAGWGLV